MAFGRSYDKTVIDDPYSSVFNAVSPSAPHWTHSNQFLASILAQQQPLLEIPSPGQDLDIKVDQLLSVGKPFALDWKARDIAERGWPQRMAPRRMFRHMTWAEEPVMTVKMPTIQTLCGRVDSMAVYATDQRILSAVTWFNERQRPKFKDGIGYIPLDPWAWDKARSYWEDQQISLVWFDGPTWTAVQLDVVFERGRESWDKDKWPWLPEPEIMRAVA